MNRVETTEKSTSVSLLHAREVVAARTRSKGHKPTSVSLLHMREVEAPKNIPPSRSCMRGRWWQRERGRNPLKSTSVSHLHARVVVAVRTGSKGHKITSVSLLHAREVVVAQTGSKLHTNHHRLALACEGGGGGQTGWKPAG